MSVVAGAGSPRRGGTTTFAPGARVVVRDEQWIVRSVQQASFGAAAVRVVGLSELVRGKAAIFLTDLDDIVELRPQDTELVLDDSPRFRRSRLYLESLLRRSPPTDSRLYVGHRAAITPTRYQLDPAALALSQPRPRILMADGVGLGKTIEVGILLAELIRRGRGQRILVVALKSILGQFQEELWARFTIPLVSLDSRGLQRVRARIPSNSNPFYSFDRVIISIDTLKKDAKYRRFLEDCRWDVIVIDECQNVAQRGSGSDAQSSQRARLARLLARTCDALVLTSATPHDGRPESFASLMNLLEPTAIANPSEYGPEDIRGLYTRRFKKDVAHEVEGSFSEREIKLVRCPTTAAEEVAFAALSEATFRTIGRRGSRSRGILFRTLLLKGFLSSPAACVATIDERLRKLGGKDQSDAAIQADTKTLGRLRRLVDAVTPARQAKLTSLQGVLEELGYGPGRPGERVVVFSERLDTLDLLHDELRRRFDLKDEQIRIFKGTQDDVEQQEIVKDFGSGQGKIRVLLGSDAASEGINLHFFCHHMVHFDIPWSLITLEQRNGRIDRFGQHDTPDIRYLLSVPINEKLKGDLRVLERLITKEQAAHDNLGDAAWLMGLYDADQEAERVAQAIEGDLAPEVAIPDTPAGNEMFPSLLDDEPPEAETTEPLSLYPDELGYARDAFEELARDEILPVHAPQWQDHLQGLILQPSEDLLERFDALPPALHPGRNGELRLTVDRKRVRVSYDEARSKGGRWPEWQLLWELSPVAQWLDDRVLALFRRNEAPVLRVPQGLERHECVYVFEGVVSNRRSQPRIVDWFGVMYDAGGHHEVFDLRQLEDLTGLGRPFANPQRPVETSGLRARIGEAVEVARAHMLQRRQQRSQDLGDRLRTEARRVRAWKLKALERINTKELHLMAGQRGGLRRDQRERLGAQRRDIEQRVARRQEWIDSTLQTVPEPYLRLVAVLVGREAD